MEEDRELERALGLCFGDLDRRDRTSAQIRARLERAGTGEAMIAAALEWLVERCYVDDAGYAERFASDRRRLDGWGRERIARRLAQDGVDAELIAAAVALDDREAGDELGRALAVLAGRASGAAGDGRDRRRALGLLARRGYEPELAEEAVRRHFDGARAAQRA